MFAETMASLAALPRPPPFAMRTKKTVALAALALLAACSSSSTTPSGYYGSSGQAGASGKKASGGAAGKAGASGKGGSGASVGGESGAGGEPGGEAGGAGPSAGTGGTGTGGTGAAPGAGGSGPGGGSTQGGQGGTGPDNPFGGGGETGYDAGTPLGCNSGPNDDKDGDGWSAAMGDCNDCDKNVNPGAVDIVNYVLDANGKPTDQVLPNDKQVDEDCSGSALLPGQDTSCDASLAVGAVSDPYDAARAMDLCNVKVEENPADPKLRKWGVIQAAFNDITGPPFATPPKNSDKPADLNFGVLPDFGAASKARGGSRLFALSAGEARAPGQPGFLDQVCSFDKGYSSSFPPGFPKQGSCGTTGDPHDGVALDLKIRVPTNAKSLLFDFRFFTCEFPEYVCEIYNDVFAVVMAPSPLMAGDPMADPQNASADIAFEATNGMKNVIGVNNQSFLTACQPGTSGYNNCKGEAELAGSGFESHAASAWLQSQVPVVPGSIIYLRFAIWDSADGILDSTAIVDHFQWSAEPGTGTNTHVAPPVN